MSSWLPMVGVAKAFAFSLVCGFLGVSCAFKVAIDLLTIAAGKSLPVSSDDEDHTDYLVWPRDRFRLVAQILIGLICCACFMALSYFLALRAFATD